MTVLQALILGVVQGFTEFLPVSSSGHLIFFPRLFGWTDQGLAFDTIVHGGTLCAVLFYFWKDLVHMIRSDRRMAWLLLLSAIPAAIVGALFGDTIETAFRSPRIVAGNLIGWGVVLGLADWYARRKQSAAPMSAARAGIMGFAQTLALIPGTSRSGITMTAGLFSGLEKRSAARFSFLMSIPIIALAGGKKMVDLLTLGGDGGAGAGALAVGFVAASVSGFFAIACFLRVIERWSFLPFVAYRIAVGISILVFLV